ncbi:hypothetical protein [Algibacter mikhailovii]|uniref:Uncharacterized protein n=1 Tax=Algibacter mikhailovii TaxID=425498 RepID=A0A918VG61_9FLAO|nr:hypothetical protein [Algibacter mikhailovii]GGZ94604.1 hypothetical protein GCM10007028_36130 [Algibacter mikhailovii]
MNQKRFSELIKSFLVQKFPEFTKTINYKDDNSFDCDLRSPTNEFSIWIATYNSEITIGLEDPSGKTDIHTHISCYEEEDINNALTDLATEINNITKGKTLLYHSDRIGYQWTNDINLILKRKNTFENIRVYNWNVN